MEKGTLIKVVNHEDETAVIIYRDENLEKKKIVKTNMVVDYYMLKEGNEAGIFVEKDKTVRFESQYNQIVENMVENLDVVNPTFKTKAKNYLRFLNLNYPKGYDKLKQNLLKLPGIYAADETLENRAIEWFYNNFEEDMRYNPSDYTAFFDIETDTLKENGKRRDGGIDLTNTPDPVNIISLYYQDIMYVFAYNYGAKNESFKSFITDFNSNKESIRQRIYERNNRPYMRGKREIQGEDIKLEDIKLSLYTTEHEMIRAFFDKVHQLDPDFLFAWNMSFDVKTLFGRLEVTQKEILKKQGEDYNKWAVQDYTKDFIADPKYAQHEDGTRFSPKYYYYITDEGKYTDAKIRRDFFDVCDGVNWLDQLIMHAILNVSGASDSDALDNVSDEMYQIGKVVFPAGMDIFDVAWKDYATFFEYSIQDVMLLKKIEQELHNATEVFELSALYKCLPKDAFSQTKSTKSFMGYEGKKMGFLIRNNINAPVSHWTDNNKYASKYFEELFGLNYRQQLIEEIAGSDAMLYRTMMDRDTHGGFVGETIMNSNKNGLSLYDGIKSYILYGNVFDKDFSSLYPSTKHALSIDDDGAVGRYVIYDDEIRERQRELGYHKSYKWKSSTGFKKNEIQDHWKLTDEGDVEDQNLMIRLFDMMISKTYSKVGEEFLGLPNTEDIIKELIKGGK